MACFISPGQRMVLAGLDFTLLRIIVFFGFFRIIIKKEIGYINLNKLDKIIIAWSIAQTIIFTIQNQSIGALINRLGVMLDSIGFYFLFRSLVRSKDDIRKIIIAFIFISFPVFIFFMVEKSTGHNVFSIFGGVPEITVIREGRLRVQGAFAHPILAGCFWAVLLPFLFSEFYNNQSNNKLILLGIFTISLIIILSASSTPIMSVLFGIIGIVFIIFKKRMKEIRFLFVIGLILLDIVMKAPVYHLISRIDISGGSTGWHRYHLIDQAILHWKEWFIWGEQIERIGHWRVWKNDITNQYILEALRGGMLTLVLFISIIIISFHFLGILIKNSKNKEMIVFYWVIGVSLFMHITNFIAVSYFGQIWILWYLVLAFIGSLYQEFFKMNTSQENITLV